MLIRGCGSNPYVGMTRVIHRHNTNSIMLYFAFVLSAGDIWSFQAKNILTITDIYYYTSIHINFCENNCFLLNRILLWFSTIFYFRRVISIMVGTMRMKLTSSCCATDEEVPFAKRLAWNCCDEKKTYRHHGYLTWLSPFSCAKNFDPVVDCAPSWLMRVLSLRTLAVAATVVLDPSTNLWNS